jgi:hypothetical protein
MPSLGKAFMQINYISASPISAIQASKVYEYFSIFDNLCNFIISVSISP